MGLVERAPGSTRRSRRRDPSRSRAAPPRSLVLPADLPGDQRAGRWTTLVDARGGRRRRRRTAGRSSRSCRIGTGAGTNALLVSPPGAIDARVRRRQPRRPPRRRRGGGRAARRARRAAGARRRHAGGPPRSPRPRSAAHAVADGAVAPRGHRPRGHPRDRARRRPRGAHRRRARGDAGRARRCATTTSWSSPRRSCRRPRVRIVDLTTDRAAARGRRVRRALGPRPAPGRGRAARGATRRPHGERRDHHRDRRMASSARTAGSTPPTWARRSGSIVTLLPGRPGRVGRHGSGRRSARDGVDVPVVISRLVRAAVALRGSSTWRSASPACARSTTCAARPIATAG